MNDIKPGKKIKIRELGRIRPFVLGLVILVAGLLIQKWWLWQIGLTILIVLFIEAYFRYRTSD
jgi:hypothetical protein